MLQIADLVEYTEQDIPKLLERIRPILSKRKQLHEKYSRGASDCKVMYTENNDETVLPFEKFITDLSAGYASGKPSYTVDVSKDEEKNKILKQLLGKEVRGEDYSKSMEILIDYITNYNDDEQENHDLFHDLFEMTSCYEVIYQNQDDEIVYSKYDPLQTVATWDYSIPANLTGIVRSWTEKNLNNKTVEMVEITDVNGTRVYSVSDNVAVEVERENHEWGDVPAIAVETDFAIFETCEDVIQAYEQLVQNIRNTFQYNDADCKLMISGYMPENPASIKQVIDGQEVDVVNPARLAEDKVWQDSQTIYVGPDGNVTWLTKPVDAEGVIKILKTYADLMFQLAGIPNTSDLAFNSTDLNASAIDRKFYIMSMMVSIVTSLLKKAYLRRWELIFNRINILRGTDFDFRDIKVDLPKNLPSNNDEMIDSMKKLIGLISNQTIVEKLGYNYLSEKEKMDNESEDNLMRTIEESEKLNKAKTNLGDDDDEGNDE